MSFAMFSYGLTKSGSTLAFHLARIALERAGHRQALLTVPGLLVSRKINSIQHVTEAQVTALEDEMAMRWGPVVMKTHTRLDPPIAGMIERGTARAHVVLRDPRDVALSMIDHGNRARAAGQEAFSEIATINDAIRALDDQIFTLRGWAALPGIQILTYDHLAFDTVSATTDIMAHMGIVGDAEAVVRHVKDTCFIQFNKGIRDRHLSDMSADTSAIFLDHFADFYRDFLPSVALNSKELS